MRAAQIAYLGLAVDYCLEMFSRARW